MVSSRGLGLFAFYFRYSGDDQHTDNDMFLFCFRPRERFLFNFGFSYFIGWTKTNIRTDTNTLARVFYGGRAGHGSFVEDTSGDEVEGMDETLCPVDCQQSGMITDDEVF